MRRMARTETVDFSDDEVWALWAPLIEVVRPRCKTPPQDLRRTLSAVVWRHENGAKWHLLDLCQKRGPSLGLALSDATVIRAHEATGGGKMGSADGSEVAVRHWAALVVATARRPA